MLQTLYTYYTDGARYPSQICDPIPFSVERSAPPYSAKKHTHPHTSYFLGTILGGNYTLVAKITGLYGTGL